MLKSFVRNDFSVKNHRFFQLPTLSKPGLDLFLQAIDCGDGTYSCRLGLNPADKQPEVWQEFTADQDGLGVIASVLVDMPNVNPTHMMKTVAKFGRNVIMEWHCDGCPVRV